MAIRGDAVTNDSAGQTSENAATLKEKPFQCPHCSLNFRRNEHLRRHIPLHTGEKPYQCPCGETFSRNDALVRHLRGCEHGQVGLEGLVKKRSTKQSRTKRACDHCSKSKAKCDSGDPCSRCLRKSISCVYTREGHRDLYSPFDIRRSNIEGSNIEAIELASPISQISSNSEAIIIACTSPGDSNGQSTDPQDFASQQSDFAQHEFELGSLPPVTCSDSYDQTILGSLDIDTNLMDIDFLNVANFTPPMDTWLYTDMDGQFNRFFSPQMASVFRQEIITPVSQQSSPSPVASGFSLVQIDPVEAKCTEIQTLLQGSEPLVTKDMIYQCVTRRNLLLFSRLYGKHFQRNFPILHSPTFRLVETPPILLLAIMLIGACYAEKPESLPSAYVTKLAMRLLVIIENQPHERDMQAPPVSSIQASTLICSILVCSRDELACKFVSVYFARNISMAERACIFDSVEAIDYNTLTEDTFDWQQWIDQESRRRIACEIFCQDMAGCIFQGKSPSFAPLGIDLLLPCYESCWEAATASECLQQLQCLPRQISLSAAMARLRSPNSKDTSLFEASGFGMSVLVLALHCLLFQATQFDFGTLNQTPRDPSMALIQPFSCETTNLLSRLRQDLSGPTVVALADEAILLHGSSTLKHVNDLLDAWRATWDRRQFRDVEHENSSFKSDPLPIWWLAKLYLALHCHAPLIRGDSEFAVPRAKAINERQKIQIQAKIIGWLSLFRRQCREPGVSCESCLSLLMKPSRDD